MLSLSFLSSVLVLGFSASALAGPGEVSPLSLGDFKLKCSELSKDEQLKPFKTIVTCKQMLTEWRPSTEVAEPLSLENLKEIGASFSLKGYSVPFLAEAVEVEPVQSPCTVLEQYKVSVPAVDFEITCEELDKVEKVSDLCGPAIQERIAADPNIQIVEATGQTINTCQAR